jgi:hypothetical protein
MEITLDDFVLRIGDDLRITQTPLIVWMHVTGREGATNHKNRRAWQQGALLTTEARASCKTI